MRFSTAKEMLDVIKNGQDLYNRENGLYVWVYNDSGSIAYGYVNEREFQSIDYSDICGHIADDPSYEFFNSETDMSNLVWCEDHINLDWEFV